MRRWGDRCVAVAAVLLVVGPLAHLAMHAPDHSHLPGGVVVRHGLRSQPHEAPRRAGHGADRGAHDHAHAPGGAHGHPHEHPHETPGDDSPAGDPAHGAGSLAHFGGAPVLAMPVLVPPRRVRVHRPRWGVEMPSPPPLRGRAVHSGWRARAPPRSSFGSVFLI